MSTAIKILLSWLLLALIVVNLDAAPVIHDRISKYIPLFTNHYDSESVLLLVAKRNFNSASRESFKKLYRHFKKQ